MEEFANQISIGRDYLQSKVRNQYADHKTAQIREGMQNSLDSGATEIHYEFNYSERTLVMKDNGCGMTDQHMINYLFKLGGSHKEKGNAVGGFGAAKLILLFQHEWFKIVSWKDGKKYEVNGCADRYSDFTITEDSENRGTIITIKFLPTWSERTLWNGEKIDEYDCFESQAKQFIQKCNFTADIFWNGEKMMPSPSGELFRKMDWASLYFKPLTEGYICSNFIRVRVAGLLMFESYVPKMSREITLELDYSSLVCLTENRDGLKGSFKNQLDSILAEVNKDSESFSKLEGKTILYTGCGEETSFRYLCRKAISEYSQSVIKKIEEKIQKCRDMNWCDELSKLNAMKESFMNDFGNTIQNDSEAIGEMIEQMASEIMEIENSLDRRERLSKINTEGLKRLVEAMSVSASNMGIESTETKEQFLNDLENKTKISSTKHDFVVKINKKLDQIKSNISPDTINSKYLRLMQLYAHSIKTISDKMDKNITFRVGWILDDNCLAMFMRENNEVTFFINPESKKWFDADSKANCVKRIARTAAHEFVHYLGNCYHDESFTAQYDIILEKLDQISSWTKFESDAYEINI